MAGQLPLAPFTRDNSGDPFFLEPREQAPELAAQDGRVRQSGEKIFDGIEDDALGSNRIDRVPYTHEQAREIVFPAFLAFTALDLHLIDHQLFRGHKPGKVVSERANVVRDVLRALFERHEYAGFVETQRTFHQERDAKQGFSATGGSAKK